MSFDPKEQFKKHHPSDYAAFRPVAQQAFFLNAVTHALASMVQAGATAEELNGANRFIESLEQLVSDKVEIRKLPVKRLEFLDANIPPSKTP